MAFFVYISKGVIFGANEETKIMEKNVYLYDIPLYRGKLAVVFTLRKDIAEEYIGDMDKDTVYGHAGVFDCDGFVGHSIVLNFDHNDLRITHGVVAHEAFHVTNMIAERVNIHADHDNDEAMACLIEWVVEKIYESMELANKQCYVKR